jgi:hypothetical protein
MDVIRHTVDNDWLMSLVFNNPTHVFENIIPPLLLKEILTSLYGKNDLDMYLGICACHDASPLKPMSSLRD